LGNASKPETKITVKTETFTRNAEREIVRAMRSNGILEAPVRKDYPDTPEGQQEKEHDDAVIKADRLKYWDKNQTEWSQDTARGIKDVLVKESQTVPERILTAMTDKETGKLVEAATSKVYRSSFPLYDEQKKWKEATEYIASEFPGGTFKKGKEGFQEIYDHVWNFHEQWAVGYNGRKKLKKQQFSLKKQKESNEKKDEKESGKAAPDAPGTVGSNSVPAPSERQARTDAVLTGGDGFGSPPSLPRIGSQNRDSLNVVSASTVRTQSENRSVAAGIAEPSGPATSNSLQKRTGAHHGSDPPAKRHQSFSDPVTPVATQGEMHVNAFMDWCLEQGKLLDLSHAEFFQDPSFSNDTGPYEYVNWCVADPDNTRDVMNIMVNYLKDRSEK